MIKRFIPGRRDFKCMIVQTAQKETIMLLNGKVIAKKTYYISSLKNKLHNIDEDYEKRYEKAFSLHGLFIIRGEDAATRRLLIWST